MKATLQKIIFWFSAIELRTCPYFQLVNFGQYGFLTIELRTRPFQFSESFVSMSLVFWAIWVLGYRVKNSPVSQVFQVFGSQLSSCGLTNISYWSIIWAKWVLDYRVKDSPILELVLYSFILLCFVSVQIGLIM